MQKPLTPKQQAFCTAYSESGKASIAYSVAFGMPVEVGSKYYVYALVASDTDEIIYIGKGKGRRVKCHVAAAKNGNIDNAPKHKAIVDAFERGAFVVELVIENELTEPEAFRFEKHLIETFKDQLTNIANGSQHNHDRAAQQAQYLLNKTKPFGVWVHTMPHKAWVEFFKEDYAGAFVWYTDFVDGLQLIINKSGDGHE